jgi:hypothetical protein
LHGHDLDTKIFGYSPRNPKKLSSAENTYLFLKDAAYDLNADLLNYWHIHFYFHTKS